MEDKEESEDLRESTGITKRVGFMESTKLGSKDCGTCGSRDYIKLQKDCSHW